MPGKAARAGEPLRVAGVDPGRHQAGDEIPGPGSETAAEECGHGLVVDRGRGAYQRLGERPQFAPPPQQRGQQHGRRGGQRRQTLPGENVAHRGVDRRMEPDAGGFEDRGQTPGEGP